MTSIADTSILSQEPDCHIAKHCWISWVAAHIVGSLRRKPPMRKFRYQGTGSYEHVRTCSYLDTRPGVFAALPTQAVAVQRGTAAIDAHASCAALKAFSSLFSGRRRRGGAGRLNPGTLKRRIFAVLPSDIWKGVAGEAGRCLILCCRCGRMGLQDMDFPSPEREFWDAQRGEGILLPGVTGNVVEDLPGMANALS
jgi:hypothetical protein